MQWYVLLGRWIATAWKGTRSTHPVRAVDGDTLRHGTEKIRLLWMDAPEEGQCDHMGGAAGLAAHQALHALCAGQEDSMRIFREGRDVYGRTLARVSTDTCDDLSYAMIARGYAIPLDGAPESYWVAFEEAQNHRWGLWARGGFEEPRAWRRRQEIMTGKPYIDARDRTDRPMHHPSDVP